MDRKKLFLVVPFVAIALVVTGVALFPMANANDTVAESDAVAVDTRSHQVQQDTVEGGDLEFLQICVCWDVQECHPVCQFRPECTCHGPSCELENNCPF